MGTAPYSLDRRTFRSAGSALASKTLDEAIAKGRTVVGVKRDWKTIFPFER